MFTKPGVYTTTDDIEFKKVLIASDGKTKYPIIVSATIPKNSIIVHAKKYNQINQVSKVEISNPRLRTNSIYFTDIKLKNETDTVSFRITDLLFVTEPNIVESQIYLCDVDTNIELTLGAGIYFSLDPKQVDVDFNVEKMLCDLDNAVQ